MEFFEQLAAALRREAAEHPGFTVDPAVWEEFFSDRPRHTAPVPSAPEREAAPVTTAVFSPPPVQRTAAPGAPPVPAPAETAADLSNIGSASLEELQDMVRSCRLCQLAQRRKNAVFGEGDPHARLLFIGEGPGEDEDIQGRPFVGKAGQLLDKMIAAMQFSRPEVYIANIVKCRPPGNRTPLPEEADCCRHYLQRQIELIAPEIIVLLGATATRFLLNTQQGITKLRGKWTEYNGIPVMPTFHPAYLLRNESSKREAWEDLKQVMARFGKFPPQRTR